VGSIYFLIFLTIILGAAAWLIFLWAVKSGQYDDPEGPKYRMLDDDEEEKEQQGRSQKK
jgi:cbb3-type cytochrome oxidase maturation protein